jgi:hypothetical protein
MSNTGFVELFWFKALNVILKEMGERVMEGEENGNWKCKKTITEIREYTGTPRPFRRSSHQHSRRRLQ